MILSCRAEAGPRLSNVHFDEVVVLRRQGHSMWTWGRKRRTFTVAVFPDGNHNKRVGDGPECQLPFHFGGAPSFIAPGAGVPSGRLWSLCVWCFWDGPVYSQVWLFIGSNEIPVCLLFCWQVLVIYLGKQDGESFFLGTCTQNGVTWVKTIALKRTE